jgi:hypothetical protein
MDKYLLIAGGVCAAIAAALIGWRRRDTDVHELADELENAWADHHTIA